MKLAPNSPEETIEPKDMQPLMRYLLVLTKQYPKPLTPKQLAKKSRVTLAAVSKIRDKLYPFCDLKARAASKRTLILRNDNSTVIQIAVAFGLDSNLATFFNTPYFRTIFRKWVLEAHNELTKRVVDYSSHFNQDDALFLTDVLLRAVSEGISKLKPIDFTALNESDIKGAIITQTIELIEQLGPNLTRILSDPENLRHVIELRDKLWLMTLQLLQKYLATIFSDILQSLPDDPTRQAYISVYLTTATFYLQRIIFLKITETIRQASEKAGLHWNDNYSHLRLVYTKATSSTPTDATIPSSSYLPKRNGMTDQ